MQTYRLFINGFKYGALGVIAILIILAFLTL
ncbi:MAG: aa3-type cytochrome c oxidase subunit IV [Methylovirgula sp.]